MKSTFYSPTDFITDLTEVIKEIRAAGMSYKESLQKFNEMVEGKVYCFACSLLSELNEADHAMIALPAVPEIFAKLNAFFSGIIFQSGAIENQVLIATGRMIRMLNAAYLRSLTLNEYALIGQKDFQLNSIDRAISSEEQKTWFEETHCRNKEGASKKVIFDESEILLAIILPEFMQEKQTDFRWQGTDEKLHLLYRQLTDEGIISYTSETAFISHFSRSADPEHLMHKIHWKSTASDLILFHLLLMTMGLIDPHVEKTLHYALSVHYRLENRMLPQTYKALKTKLKSRKAIAGTQGVRITQQFINQAEEQNKLLEMIHYFFVQKFKLNLPFKTFKTLYSENVDGLDPINLRKTDSYIYDYLIFFHLYLEDLKYFRIKEYGLYAFLSARYIFKSEFNLPVQIARARLRVRNHEEKDPLLDDITLFFKSVAQPRY